MSPTTPRPGVLSENLSNMGYYPETWAVFGMLADKDVAGGCNSCAGGSITGCLPRRRARGDRLQRSWPKIVSTVSGARMRVCVSVAEAFELAGKSAAEW